MNVHYFQHVPFEGIGIMEEWFQSRKFNVTSTKVYESTDFPAVADLDFLVVMGGPMSVNDEELCPWLIPEKRFIKSVIDADKPVLGVCLGAQLIAVVSGARVYPNAECEIGWFPIEALQHEGMRSILKSESVFHWHGETFDLPAGAVQLAKSEACANQAFLLKEKVLGLQFHIETTPESAAALIENCREELIAGKFVQPEEFLRAVSDDDYKRIHCMLDDVLNYLCF